MQRHTIRNLQQQRGTHGFRLLSCDIATTTDACVVCLFCVCSCVWLCFVIGFCVLLVVWLFVYRDSNENSGPAQRDCTHDPHAHPHQHLLYVCVRAHVCNHWTTKKTKTYRHKQRHKTTLHSTKQHTTAQTNTQHTPTKLLLSMVATSDKNIWIVSSSHPSLGNLRCKNMRFTRENTSHTRAEHVYTQENIEHCRTKNTHMVKKVLNELFTRFPSLRSLLDVVFADKMLCRGQDRRIHVCRN